MLDLSLLKVTLHVYNWYMYYKMYVCETYIDENKACRATRQMKVTIYTCMYMENHVYMYMYIHVHA